MSDPKRESAPADEGRIEAPVRPQVMLPNMCNTHQTLLVRQCGYGPQDPWRALLIVTQIALFQGATADAKVHAETGGKPSRRWASAGWRMLRPNARGNATDTARTQAPKR